MDDQKPKLGTIAHNKAASADGAFLPRSEFWKASVIPHSFALLSFNGNEILRLANCPDNVVSAVKRALPQDDIRHFREDPDIVVCEFLLAGKPFSRRSVRQEQLLLNIFTAIMSQNYTLVTSIDYGRIYLDRLTLAFKRALTPASEKQHTERSEAFGLSFVSSTALRVVSPPLRFTPAILQVVRSAWPLGVVGEKRESDGSYLFKLKGYSFFKQSTFETDSLTHTLELLRGMDGHGFTLITSMCLSKRSRVQDFWIFSAPAPPLPPTTNAGLAAISSLHKAGGSVGGGTMTTTASLEANQPPSPVHSHSMLGLSNTGDSPRTRNAAPRSPAPSSSSGGKPNPAVVANYYDRPPPNPLRRNNESPTTAHSRRTSLPGSSHVLRKTPPVSMSKPGTPTRDYRTPDPTPRPSPRPSPREETGNLQHSSSQPNLPAPTPSHHQYQQYPQLYQQQPGAYAPAPDPNPQRQQQQHLQPPQSHSIIHRPTSDTSSQFLYSVSPPPPGEYQPVYNTVPSGMFILPNIPQSQSQPQATGPPRPSLPGISESPASSIPPPLRDLELEADDATEYDDDGDDEHEGLGISSKLLGSSVFRDTLQTSADYDDDDDDDSPGSGNNHRAYLNSVGVADYSGVPENDVRRMREATTTIVNEGYAHAGNTPRFVHPDLPEDDPARRASDELLFSFAGSPPAAAPQPFLTSARLPHPQSEDTTLGADRFERYHEAPRQTPAWSGASMDDDSSTMPSPATEEERPTTKAAAAEPISNSGNLAKKQSRSLNPNTGVAKPETSLTVRVVDEQTKNGPWVLVSPPEGAAPNGGAPSSSFPASVVPDAGTSRHRHDVKEQEDGEKNNLGTGVTPPSRPAAVPVPIPTNEERRTATKPRMGTFPWSKSRREQREKEKTQEKEKEKQRKAEEESKRAVPPSSKKPTTAVQKDRDDVESEQRHATITPTPAKPSTEKVEAAATSSSASSSSSSVLQTPSGVAEGHQSPPPINESSFTKDLVGRLRRKPHAITEVGTTEKRLTIE